MARGRPRLPEAERARREKIASEWAIEVKACSGLSSSALEEALVYGEGSGRTWRALMAGTRIPSPVTMKRLTKEANKKGWLKPLWRFRYEPYWTDLGDEGDVFLDTEHAWRNGTLARTLLMLLAHARKCGVGDEQFFTEAQAELARMQSFLDGVEEDDLEQRARRVADETVQRLLKGPEYPTTGLSSGEP